MLFEYFSLTGMGDSAFTFEFISRVVLLVLAGLALVLVGFKVKGVWGAALALAAGVLFFLYNEGMIGF
jgi:hypothetical protein